MTDLDCCQPEPRAQNDTEDEAGSQSANAHPPVPADVTDKHRECGEQADEADRDQQMPHDEGPPPSVERGHRATEPFDVLLVRSRGKHRILAVATKGSRRSSILS